MNLLIKGGRVIDPANKIDSELDILIEGPNIKEIFPKIVKEGIPTIDAKGKLVVPGLIDVHVHFREIDEKSTKETIKSVSHAAARGGFTTIICQPNIRPRVDNAKTVKLVLDYAKKDSLVNFYQSACITKGSEHKELVAVKEIKRAGAIKLTDDGDPVIYPDLMLTALKEAKEHNIVVSPHCESSPWAEPILKLEISSVSPPIPCFRDYRLEPFFVRRDIRLAKLTQSPLHISHVSLAESLNEIRNAKKSGLQITCEVTPHHLLLTAKAKELYGTNAKVNPPLREDSDIQALLAGLKDSTIDVIASDHAPHMVEDKQPYLPNSADGRQVTWDSAAFGIIGLETTLGLVLTFLVNKKILSLNDAIAKLTMNPAKIFNLCAGSIGVEKSADITVIDLDREWVVDVDQFESMGRNCPFNGWQLKGKAVTTIAGGKIVMQDGQLLNTEFTN